MMHNVLCDRRHADVLGDASSKDELRGDRSSTSRLVKLVQISLKAALAACHRTHRTSGLAIEAFSAFSENRLFGFFHHVICANHAPYGREMIEEERRVG